jgi:hypothetical protein
VTERISRRPSNIRTRTPRSRRFCAATRSDARAGPRVERSAQDGMRLFQSTKTESRRSR